MYKNGLRVGIILIICISLMGCAFTIKDKEDLYDSYEHTKVNVNYEEELDKYKQKFMKEYDIDLHIHNTSSIPYVKVEFDAVSLNEEVIEYVYQLDNALREYPTGFFKEIKYYQGKDRYKEITAVYLGTNLELDGKECGGVASCDDPNRNLILLNIESTLELKHVFAHELFHIIENKGIAEGKMYINPMFRNSRWDSYNPKEFEYLGSEYSKNNMFLEGEPEEIHFVSSYAKKNRSEDMAEVFGMMMSYEEDNVPDSFYSPHVINKMRFISEFLEENYESATDEAHWNRWLNSVDK